MSQTGPWTKFNTDQRARDAAREAAMAEGITLGEYLNRLLTLVDEPQPNETSFSYSRRTGAAAPPPIADSHESAATLDRLTRRIEATEARSTLAINGIDDAVHNLVARLQNTEKTTASIAGHVEGLIAELRETHETLQTKVRHLESDDNSQHTAEAFKVLEGALGKLATHVYEEGELTQNETAAIKGRIESGFTDIGERVEGIETRVDRSLSETAARMERAVEEAEQRAHGATRILADRMLSIESHVQERLQAAGQIAGPTQQRISAVEADVSGALNSMESTLGRIQERLNRAETGTDSALKSLETTFAHLDERIEAVASQIDPKQAERLKQEFEKRFEDLTRSVRSAVDNARFDLATEITKAAAGQDEKLEERLKAEVSELKAHLASVEARAPAEITAAVQEEIGRLGSVVAERIDALAAHVDDRIEESELRSADAIEQVGEQVTVAAVRLQKRQDEALNALAQDIQGMRAASDARLSDALASVSERLERIQGQSSEAMSPVQRAIAALATRLESLEAFSTPPHVPGQPPILPRDFVAQLAPAPAARTITPQPQPQIAAAPHEAAPAAPAKAASRPASDYTPELKFDLKPQAEPAPHPVSTPTYTVNVNDDDFEAGFSGWEVVETKVQENPYKADFDAIPGGAPSRKPAAAAGHSYVADVPEEDIEYDGARSFDPVDELDRFATMDDSLEGSHAETRESDIFDDEEDEPDFAATLAQTQARPAQDDETADYLTRARRAALVAAQQNGRSGARPNAASSKAASNAGQKSGGARVPMILAASAVAITGAGVGGYLYLRGKQPVTPSLSGPVDTYVDPAAKLAAPPPIAQLAEAASRPAPLDAEQMLFEDEMASVDSALFDETEAETETASTDVPAAAEPKATTPILASVQTARPATKIAPEPAEDLTPEQAAIRSIVRAADAIEASSAPSLKPAAPDQLAGAPTDFPEPVRAPVRNGTFAPIPDVVTVEAEANAGNAVAQYQYAQVKLSEGDLEAAAAFLRRASQKGIAPAQYELGKLHERGQGVDKDLTEARNLIQKAAEAGHVGAMYDYALFLAEGEGGAKSEADAVTWFQQAAQHGLVDAQYNLGVVHAEGIGTSQDLVTALFWFEIAAKAGDTGAEQEVKNLRTRVSMSDALETSERVKDWKAKQPVALANGRFGAQRWNTGNPLQVKAVQTALGSLGFDAGAPDGVLGRRTGGAISDYQSMQNLEVTGTITPELVKHLNARASGTRSS